MTLLAIVDDYADIGRRLKALGGDVVEEPDILVGIDYGIGPSMTAVQIINEAQKRVSEFELAETSEYRLALEHLNQRLRECPTASEWVKHLGFWEKR